MKRNALSPASPFCILPAGGFRQFESATLATTQRSLGAARSFTLVELLVVVSIMAVLMLISIPAFNAISGAHSVVSGAYNVQSLIELARNEAIARQSYVWVGFSNVDNPVGSPQILIAAVASIDGSTNSSQTNLAGLARPLRAGGLVLTNWSGLKNKTQNLFTNGIPESVSTNTAGITFTLGTSQFKGETITFTPRGEALLMGAPSPSDGYTQTIDISLRQAHGTTVTADADDASVMVDGATGNSQIVRLQ